MDWIRYSMPRGVTILLMVSGLIAGCGTGDSIEKDNVRVSDVKLTRLESGAKIVTGQIENGADESISGLQIQVSLLDPDNRRVDSMSIVVRDLAAGESRRFRQPVDSEFEVEGIRARSLLFP